MLTVAIVVLVIGAGYAVNIAPRGERLLVAGVIAVLAVGGYFAGSVVASNPDERTYYSIAGAIGGAMIAFAWISQRQKSWPKDDDKS